MYSLLKSLVLRDETYRRKCAAVLQIKYALKRRRQLDPPVEQSRRSSVEFPVHGGAPIKCAVIIGEYV